MVQSSTSPSVLIPSVSRTVRVALSVVVCTACGILGPTAFAQEPDSDAKQSVIRANVNLVSTPVVVLNKKGDLKMDLNSKNFRVFDNGVEQILDTFEISDAPLSLVIVVENSSRIAPLMPIIRSAGLLFTHAVVGETGEAAVIAYGDDVVNLLEFTSDQSDIEKAFADLQSGGSGAHMYDALARAVNALRKVNPLRRKVIIVLAEAFDNGSKTKINEVMREAQMSNTVIYSVGLSTIAAEVRAPQKQAGTRVAPEGIFTLPRIPGSVETPTLDPLRLGNIDLGGLVRPIWAFAGRKPPIEAATLATGGFYRSTMTRASVEKAINDIGGELHEQYVISYSRTGNNAPGYHEIKVEFVGKEALKARYRSGYYLAQP
jgi:VWFA-related protein